MGRDRHRRDRHKCKRKEQEPFLLFRRALIHSPQFSALSAASRALIFELHAIYNGTNNGTLFLSVRSAAARLGFSDLKAATNAINELNELGWITETLGASFGVKAGSISRARAWRLNWISPTTGKCVGPEALPPLKFNRLSKAQKRRVHERQCVLERFRKEYQKNRIAMEETSTLDVRIASAEQRSVEKSSTLNSGNDGKPSNRFAEKNSTHIYTIGGVGEPDPGQSEHQRAAKSPVSTLNRNTAAVGSARASILKYVEAPF